MSEHMLELLRDAQAERNALRARVGSLEEMLADAAADVAVAIAERDRLRFGVQVLRDRLRRGEDIRPEQVAEMLGDMLEVV